MRVVVLRSGRKDVGLLGHSSEWSDERSMIGGGGFVCLVGVTD